MDLKQVEGEPPPAASAFSFWQPAWTWQILTNIGHPRYPCIEESEKASEAIIAGYQDAIEGRLVEYQGDLRTLLKTSLE